MSKEQKYYLVVNDQIENIYFSLEAANDALDKRAAKDNRVDQAYEFKYQILKAQD